MKRLLNTLVTILFIMILGAPAMAQSESKMIAPAPDGSAGQLFGQDHAYSLVFRGNGEAVVSARISFTNSDAQPIKTLELRVPKVQPNDLMSYQVLRDEQRDYGWYGPAKYQKATTELAGDTITITFPQPIKANTSGTVLLAFRAFGYAKKDFAGSYHYTFESLKATEPVQQLQVGISTDSDLVLRGTQGSVNYRFEDVGTVSKDMAQVAAPTENARMDNYIQQIGYGQITKTASNLQALESYTVGGSYGTSMLKLYAKEGLIGAAIALVLIIGIIWAIKHTSSGIIIAFIMSFVSAAFMLCYSGILFFLTRNLNNFFGYDVVPMVTILLLVLSLAIFGFLLVAPALFVGIKRGWVMGLTTAGLTIVWLFIGLILLLAVFSGKSAMTGRGGIMPMMLEKTIDVSAPSLE